MENNFHLGRQPILNRKGELVAYELLFRSSTHNAARVDDDFHASAHVIQTAFSQFGLEQVLGTRLGFINVSADLLMSDVLELLPCQQIVLEILETVTITPEIVSRCKELAAKGFKLAVDDIVSPDQEQLALLPYVQYVKIDVLAVSETQLAELARSFIRHPVKLLAEKVDSQAQRDYCLKLGFDLFQGYYFAKPTILSGQKPKPSQMALLKLLGLVNQDAETTELETAFKQSPDLTVNLLKLVNSVAFGATSKVGSVGRALALLGRQQLKRWIHLLAFTHNSNSLSGMDPLAQMAAVRGKLMELSAQAHYPTDRDLPEKAFMVGMLSLLDALFHQPLPELIESLNLTDDVRAALLEGSGTLGRLLAMAQALEFNRAPDEAEYADTNQLLLAAMHWANELEQQQ